MRAMNRPCIVGLIGLALLVGCASSGEPSKEPAKNSPAVPNSPLTGTYWRLVELNGKPALRDSDAREAHFILQGGEGRYVGSGGVNRLLGTYKASGKSIKFLPGISTMMAGPEPLMKQEFSFSSTLEGVDSYKIDGRSLTLFSAGKAVMRLEAMTFK